MAPYPRVGSPVFVVVVHRATSFSSCLFLVLPVRVGARSGIASAESVVDFPADCSRVDAESIHHDRLLVYQ